MGVFLASPSALREFTGKAGHTSSLPPASLSGYKATEPFHLRQGANFQSSVARHLYQKTKFLLEYHLKKKVDG